MKRGVSGELWGSLIDQADTASSSSGGRENLPNWIIKNTRDPKNPNKDWSFKYHEYQIGIIQSKTPHIVVNKSAQVGISELFVRLLLALGAKLSGENLLYTLPTASFAARFSVSRIDNVISSSPRLKLLVPNSVNSMQLKKIGSCYAHISGCSDEKQAISVPAKVLINDEFSFSSPHVLSTFQSRLSHNKPEDRWQFDFSTPLFPKMGITKEYEAGTQAEYMCYHDACGQWVVVNSLEDIVLPGWDDHLLQLSPADLNNGVTKPKESWVKCSACHTEISRENLTDPSRRAWVERFPDREVSSFNVDPSCAAYYRSAPNLIADLALYRKVPTWCQFAMGQAYESADATILQSALDEAFTVPQISPLSGSSCVTGSCSGMDVGVTSHLCHGKKVDGVLEIFNMETVRQGYENELTETYLKRMKTFKVVKGVIDAAPDLTSCKAIQGKTAWNTVWGAFFVRGRGGNTLEIYDEDEVKGVVKLRRTALFDEFVAEFNAGRIKLPRGMVIEREIKSHFLKPKRITQPDAVGEDSSVWISSGADHWIFSVLYCFVASKMLEQDSKNIVLPMSKIAGKIRVGGKTT